jgi:hypothetical protein
MNSLGSPTSEVGKSSGLDFLLKISEWAETWAVVRPFATGPAGRDVLAIIEIPNWIAPKSTTKSIDGNNQQ